MIYNTDTAWFYKIDMTIFSNLLNAVGKTITER